MLDAVHQLRFATLHRAVSVCAFASLARHWTVLLDEANYRPHFTVQRTSSVGRTASDTHPVRAETLDLLGRSACGDQDVWAAVGSSARVTTCQD